MAEGKNASVALNNFIQAGRKKKENERLAQEMLGKRRASTPGNTNTRKPGGLATSLASRVGVTKRPSQVQRTNSARNTAPRPDRPTQTLRKARSIPAKAPKSNGTQSLVGDDTVEDTVVGVTIKGAAGGPYIVMASNFDPGTTAADIHSVMASVGGELTYCKLVASAPTVIAEMGFKERSGADTVIDTFNNKKADGRTLYVYMKEAAPFSRNIVEAPIQQVPPPEPEVSVTPSVVDESMDIDETAKSREAADRLREERRGGSRDERERTDVFPTGPRGPRGFGGDDYYYNNRGPTRPEPGYQDGRYGFGGGGYGGGGGGYGGGRGRYYDDRRSYGRGGGGGGRWRS